MIIGLKNDRTGLCSLLVLYIPLLGFLWQDCGNIVVIVGHRMGWSPFPGTTVDRVSPVLTRERVVYHP